MTKTGTVAEGVPIRTSAYYVWHAPGKALAVHLSLDVVERMEREVLDSFKAITQRGSEIGGLLLGRMPANQPIVVVEDYEGVSCDYARGPLYLLAEADKERLAAAIRRVKAGTEKGLAVVGFFRGNTRRDLALDEDDLALMREHFAESRQVCLLVKPFSMKPSVGGFFIWETGRIEGQSSYLQFPFRRSELTKAEHAKAIVGDGELAAAAAIAGPVPVNGPGAAAAKPEARVTIPPAPAPREEPAPAPATAPRGELRVSIPLVIPKREEPAAPKPEARAPVSPGTVKREPTAPPPPPPAPATRADARILVPPVILKREPSAPLPSAPKPEARAPVLPVVPKRETPAPPPLTKPEARTPVTPVVPKPEPAPPPKPESRGAGGPVVAKREEAPLPPPKPPARSTFTSLSLTREEAPPPPKAETREAPAAKRAEAAAPAISSKPEVAAPPAAKREEPAPPAVKREPPAPVKAEEPAEAAPGTEGQPRRLPYAIAAVVAVILIGAGGLLFLRPGAGKNARPTAAPDAASLALRVERNAGQLLLSWNREATMVKTAQAAVLSIFDGDHKEDVKLDLGQLRSGSIVYSPVTNDVSFKLEVTDGKGQSANETVRVIAGRPSPAAPLGQAAPAKPGNAAADSQAGQEQAAQPGSPPAADGVSEASPTPGGGAEPPVPAKQAPAQFRTESLAARLSPAPSLPEPPGLEGQSGAAPVRAVETPGTLPPPPTPVPKPAAPQATPAAAPETSAATPAPGQPLRVGGNVEQALPIRQVTPVYPPLARQARVAGVVRVEATIGKDGRVVKVQAISGPPLLRQAAQDAVQQWVYRPSTLNGQAVEVVTQVDVTFNLNR